jgi:hypothetical protein
MFGFDIALIQLGGAQPGRIYEHLTSTIVLRMVIGVVAVAVLAIWPIEAQGTRATLVLLAAGLSLDNISMAVRAAAAVVDRQRGAALNIVVPDSCHFLGFWSSGWCFAWSAGCWGGPLTH